MDLIPGWGRSLGEGNGNPLQFSCLENCRDREEPGGLQSMRSQRVGHDWVTKTHTHSILLALLAWLNAKTLHFPWQNLSHKNWFNITRIKIWNVENLEIQVFLRCFLGLPFNRNIIDGFSSSLCLCMLSLYLNSKLYGAYTSKNRSTQR